ARTANRMRRAVEIRNQVCKVLRSDVLLQPLRHERQSGRANVRNVAAQNLFISAAGLGQRDRSGGFSADDAGEKSVVLGLHVISNESRLDRRVWVENCGQKIRRRFVGQRAEIWTDSG